MKQWERFEHIHWGVLAHSTHLRGQGTYDPVTCEERLRSRVTLATRIPREVCERINLGYLNPATVHIEAWKKAPDTLVVPRAGAMLLRTARAMRGSI